MPQVVAHSFFEKIRLEVGVDLCRLWAHSSCSSCIPPAGTASQGHVDTDENLLYVIRGSKVLTMMSPLFSTALHADETRIMGVLDQNFGRLDLKKWPRYAGVRYVMAEVNAGDGVYLPQNWWHQVNSTSTHQLGVATWWKSRPEQRNIPKEVGPAGKYFKGKRLKVR
jgi:hypothetical protein